MQVEPVRSHACKGSKESHYLIADVGTVDTLKNNGVHSKRIPQSVLPDAHFQTLNTKHCILPLPLDLQDRQDAEEDEARHDDS